MLGSSPAGIMLAVAQMEEQWIVAPQVAGSSPVSHSSRVGSIGTALELKSSIPKGYLSSNLRHGVLRADIP